MQPSPRRKLRPIATVGLTAGWATFGQAVPQGLAHDGLRVGNLATQTDVKNRWPDGSIRFAIVTARVPSAGVFAVAPAPPSTGDFSPSWPGASVTLVIDGITYSAMLPSALPEDTWLSGPLVHEGRHLVAPITAAGGTAHPFIRVNFDTRVYNDGTARLDISVENVLDAAEATTVTYDVTIRINGQAVFTKNSVQHFYLTRWRKVFTTGSTVLASITPDLTPFYASGALPSYMSQVGNIVSTPAGPTYDLLRAGALQPNMSDEGNRPELAPYPDWTARYLVHRDATQRSFVLANGDLSGSWPIHVREAETSGTSGVGAERLVSIEQRPAIWLGDRAEGAAWDAIKGAPLPLRAPGIPTAGPGQSELLPDNAHQPSLAYVPYLMTGDRYYAEEMAFWANYAHGPNRSRRRASRFAGNSRQQRSARLRLGAAQSRGRRVLLSRCVSGEGLSLAESDQQSPMAQRVRRCAEPERQPVPDSVDQQAERGRAVHRALGAKLPGARDRPRESAGVCGRTGAPRCDRQAPTQAVRERARLSARVQARPICSPLEPRTRPTPPRWRRSIRP